MILMHQHAFILYKLPANEGMDHKAHQRNGKEK